MRIIFGLFLFAATALAQRNSVLFHGGAGFDISNWGRYDTAVNLGATYERRFAKWLGAETGVLVALRPSEGFCTGHGCYTPDDRIVWVSFGLRARAPLGRLELSLGAGGLRESYRDSSGLSSYGQHNNYDGWGFYAAPRATCRLGRLTLGGTSWFLIGNPPYARDRFAVVTGDVGFRW